MYIAPIVSEATNKGESKMDSRDELILKLVDRLAAVQSKPSVESEVEAIKALGLRIDSLTTERNILAGELKKAQDAAIAANRLMPKRDSLLRRMASNVEFYKLNGTDPVMTVMSYGSAFGDNIMLQEVLDYIAEANQ